MFGVGDRVKISIPKDEFSYYIGFDAKEYQNISGEIVYQYDKGSFNVMFPNDSIVTFYKEHLILLNKAPEGYRIDDYSFSFEPINDFMIEIRDSDGKIEYDFDEDYSIVEQMFNIRLKLEDALSINNMKLSKQYGNQLNYFLKTIDKDTLKEYNKFYRLNKNIILDRIIN